MNEITMIAINKLRHHPKNPRKSIGDVTELAESIKANGILQNLTVVQCPTALGEYWVVIGNRRLEAAKQAGIKELPCLISNMDEKEQFSTMLVENMQRADLTIPEQAEGFQLMIDMGESVESISDKTGFSQSTVRRRLDLAKLNKKKFEKAYESGGTLDDFVKISQIESKKEQNELLNQVGTNNFNFAIQNALRNQECDKKFKKAEKILKNHDCIQLTLDKSWSNKYEHIWNDSISLESELNISSIERKAKKYDFYCRSYSSIHFYKKVERSKKPKKTQEEIEASKMNKLRSIKEKEFFELRENFIKELSHKRNITAGWEKICLNAAVDAISKRIYLSSNVSKLFELGGIEYDYGAGYEVNEERRKAWEEAAPAGFAVCCIYSMFNDSKTETYFGYQGSLRKNLTLDVIYRFLCALGYQMCDEETAWQNGTHELFGKEHNANESLRTDIRVDENACRV